MTMMNVPQPGQDSDGDYDTAEDMWQAEASTHWTPPCWHMSPEQLQATDREWLFRNYASVSAAATKHSNPPAYTALRPF